MTRRRTNDSLPLAVSLFTACISIFALCLSSNTAYASDEPLRMRGEPTVYATPFTNMVIVDFELYDNVTWCRLYVRREVWEAAKANKGVVHQDDDPGQIECYKK